MGQVPVDNIIVMCSNPTEVCTCESLVVVLQALSTRRGK